MVASREEREETSRASRGRGPASAAPASELSVPDRVLALQRTAGNAAVARMVTGAPSRVLARDPPLDAGVGPTDAGVPPAAGVPIAEPRPGDVEDIDRAIGQYLEINDYRNAARVMNLLSQGDIDSRIPRYTQHQREELYDAAQINGDSATRIRVAIDLENAVQSRDWPAAGRILDGYPERAARVPAQLRRLGSWIGALLLAAADENALGVAAVMRPVVEQDSAASVSALPDQAGFSSYHVAVLLNAMTDHDREASVARLNAAQLFDASTEAGSHRLARVTAILARQPYAELIRVEGLDRNFRGAMGRGDTAAEAAILAQYARDPDRQARLQWLSLQQTTALAAALRGAGGPLYNMVEARRVQKLNQDYAAAVNAGQWAVVVYLLGAYNDADLLPKAQMIMTQKGAAGISAAQAIARALYPDDNHRVRRILQYVPLQSSTGAVARPTDAVAWNTGAAAGAGVAVAGGTVNVFEHVAFGTGAPDWFAFDYRGAQAENTGWLQFVSEEIERFDSAAGGASLGYYIPDTQLHGSGQPNEPIDWNTASETHWYLDTFSDQFPFYESPVSASPPSGFAAAGTRGGHSTVPSPAANPATGQTMMVDMPGSVVSDVHDAFQPIHSGGFLGIGGTTTQVKRVEHRVRFHDYLVRGNEVLYENTMTVRFSYAADPGAAGPMAPRTNTAGVGRQTTRLEDGHFRALLRRFPAWGFYPH